MRDLLDARAAETPDALALVDAASGARLTYAAWNARAARMAGWMRARGIGRGDRVAVVCENRLAYLDAVFACAKRGAMLLNVSPRLPPREREAIVLATRPRVVLGEDVIDGAYADVPLTEIVDVAPDDPWLVVWTGGSTGRPKGAVLSHRAVRANAEGTAAGWGLRAGDVAILDMPLHHTGGLNVLTIPLVVAGGASIVCARFDPDQTFALCAQATILFAVPTMLVRLAADPRFAALARLRLAITGGAPAPAALVRRYRDAGIPLCVGYGLSEAGPNNLGLDGRPLAHVEARVADDGELCLRGPHLMSGYLDDPVATAFAIDADGWLHTGDLAARDADGRLAIVGRKKDMYISGGENVFPAAVEAALCEHTAIAEAAVIGLPHALWGEAGLCAVAVHAGARLDPDELRAFLASRLAAYQLPKAYLFVDALPRTPVGKVDKPAIARLGLDGPAGAWMGAQVFR